MGYFFSTKTYDHNEGLSCVFRQWRATDTHCSFLHGYALRFKITFGCTKLDDRNWVQNFGGLKCLKEWLHHMFDHTVVIAKDDPALDTFLKIEDEGLIKLRIVEAVGCEKMAELVYNYIQNEQRLPDCVWVESVEVSEHAGNSAIYQRSRIE